LAGWRVVVADQPLCCGLIFKSILDKPWTGVVIAD
jgi:hypothetical protein